MMKMSQPEVAVATRANPGETLRQAREHKGWSTSQVAGQLNLTENSLRHLEQGNFDQLPGHTFARGYVRAYAKLLGMDQAQMVTAFDQFTGTDATGSTPQSLGRVAEPRAYRSARRRPGARPRTDRGARISPSAAATPGT